jgi:hypothetical protein
MRPSVLFLKDRHLKRRSKKIKMHIAQFSFMSAVTPFVVTIAQSTLLMVSARMNAATLIDISQHGETKKYVPDGFSQHCGLCTTLESALN